MGDFTDPWNEYRRRRNWALLAAVGYLPILLVAMNEIEREPHDAPTAVAALMGWLGFAIFTGIRCERFKCPRCGKWFFARTFYHNAFARRCLHCGLPKYALPESQSPPGP